MARNDEKKFMMAAIRLARKAKGRAFPNPMVGAVIVGEGRVISRGFHRKAGLPHAEALALKRAGRRSRGADLYVNLEPCAHYGKTPPCVKKIIKSGIKRVYVAMKDPNPLVNGKGIRALRRKNIRVKCGICRKEAENLNKPYTDYIEEKYG